MNQSNVAIIIQSAQDRPRQLKMCVESLLANTDREFRLIVNHVTHCAESTQYLLDKLGAGQLQHLFLHDPQNDWWPSGFANACASVFRIHYGPLGPPPPEWLVLSCDDMEFQSGWLSHSLNTIEAFKGLTNIGIWSPYRPPEHTFLPPMLEHNGYQALLYASIAPRCMMVKTDLFFELGCWPLHKAHTADWGFMAKLEERGLQKMVIGGYKVLHKDLGHAPAHGQKREDGISGDEVILGMYGGYRGEPGTTWPPEQGRPG
ncbi:hypothetical protein HY496_01020 [Candidatus Woesearchaeota archaeon]|nr:hypothetical protein [Candidatus Woesearchaeota archaeon]